MVVGFRTTLKTVCNSAHNVFHLEFVAHMELRGEADLNIADPLCDVVLRELVGDAFNAFCIAQCGAGVCKPLQVFPQVGVAVFEDQFTQAALFVRRQFDAMRLGQFYECTES